MNFVLGECINSNTKITGPEGLPPITFSHHYSKLDGKEFPTIRRRDKKYKIGQIRFIRLHDGNFKKALIIYKNVKAFMDIPTDFLLKDTDKKTREEAVRLFNSFYRNPISPDEKMIIIVLRWVLNREEAISWARKR